MFKKWCFGAGGLRRRFYINESISSKSQVKSSVARTIRKNILDQYPDFEKYADEVFPKKENVVVAKWWEAHVLAFLIP